MNLELMKAGCPSVDIKFTDWIAYYNVFDEYHVKHEIGAMGKLFARYVNERFRGLFDDAERIREYFVCNK